MKTKLWFLVLIGIFMPVNLLTGNIFGFIVAAVFFVLFLRADAKKWFSGE